MLTEVVSTEATAYTIRIYTESDNTLYSLTKHSVELLWVHGRNGIRSNATLGAKHPLIDMGIFNRQIEKYFRLVEKNNNILRIEAKDFR